MSAPTWLKVAGNILRTILGIAKIAEPIIDLAVPEVAAAYNSVLGLAVAAEATAESATGTGTQKLAEVVGKVGPDVAKLFGGDAAAMQKWVSAVVDTLNLIPSKTA